MFLRPPRRAGRPRADRLPAGEAASGWRAALGRDCGNGGVLLIRACLPRLPPPHPQQRNPAWRAWAVLCVGELWHSPLRLACIDAPETSQAQRYVKAAYEQIRVDIESCGVDRVHQVAKLVNILESTIVIALEHRQCAAAVGAAKELRELIGLSA